MTLEEAEMDVVAMEESTKVSMEETMKVAEEMTKVSTNMAEVAICNKTVVGV
jgi:hypothetical protein